VSDDVLNPRTAERLVRAARAAQTLSEALWEALHEELIDPRGSRVAELSERLAEVSTAVASLARVDAAISVQAQTQATPGDDATERPPTSERPPAGERPDAPAEPRSRVVSVEHDEHGPSRASFSPRDAPPTREETSSAAVLVDELAPEETIAPPVSSAQEPPAALEASVLVTPEIEIRDERGDRAAAAWIASIGRRLERYERDGVPFAVLLIELADVERLRHAELPGEVARLTGLVETALANELRPADSLTRESPGRYWLLAPETDSGGARELAGRLAEAVRGAASHRGTPLQVVVGFATCPADGSQAAALAAHADIALYAARSAGRPIA
jgi:GGDEF domain-containing protein